MAHVDKHISTLYLTNHTDYAVTVPEYSVQSNDDDVIQYHVSRFQISGPFGITFYFYPVVFAHDIKTDPCLQTRMWGVGSWY